jgi:high-affinity iron transporter
MSVEGNHIVTRFAEGSCLPKPAANPTVKALRIAGVIAGAAVIIAVFVWQGITSNGNPDPTVGNLSPTAAIVDTGVLVFREGLEAILVLAALTASLARTEEAYWKPVALGAGVSFLACIVTYFIAFAIVSDLANNIPALEVQAVTGLLAIFVLLIIMNWFFHRIYWTGWINFQNRRKKALTQDPTRSRAAIFRGLAIIGFTSVYREGFEIVIFLQAIRMRNGPHVIFWGVTAGVAFTVIVAMLTFVAHYRLPYKKMLVLTGIMLGAVLTVMIGENVQELQQCNWVGQHTFATWPQWTNVWFAVAPDWETCIAQLGAIAFVVGSYFIARRACSRKIPADPALRCDHCGFNLAGNLSGSCPNCGSGTLAATVNQCILPDCAKCDIANLHAPVMPRTKTDASAR